MKLFRISQSFNTDPYTYDSAVVVAETAQQAKKIIPSPFYIYDDGFYFIYKNQEMNKEKTDPSWCHPKHVKAEEIGETIRKEGEVITASYNAGFDESRYLDLRALNAAYSDSRAPASTKKRAKKSIDSIHIQQKDRGLSELRYHLVEANRAHDVKKTLEYEIKLRDYMGEIHEDWS
jgi:hypothetical protein